jgi:hypothetical protein
MRATTKVVRGTVERLPGAAEWRAGTARPACGNDAGPFEAHMRERPTGVRATPCARSYVRGTFVVAEQSVPPRPSRLNVRRRKCMRRYRLRPSSTHRGGRQLTKRAIALVLAGLAAMATVGVIVATAAVPTFPDNLVVFPNRDFISVEGFQDHVGETATIEIKRGSTVMSAGATTPRCRSRPTSARATSPPSRSPTAAPRTPSSRTPMPPTPFRTARR